MPYIDEDQKSMVEAGTVQSVGQLTYGLTIPIRQYLKYIRSLPVGSLRYEHLADVVAALEECKLEFQRNVVVPYERCKQAENGDVDWGNK